MRDTTLGRWMTRLAVTVGVGAAALGLSATVAQASVTGSEASSVKLASVAHAIQVNAEPVFVTESWDWG
ncbi:hypothetical protein GCM10010532_019830 [Dactylosporangium siamense]|uniref:Uncharacterized protein n=1 Tax=Dactylosporangium siamense TaxID=685454 RepID=A0A919PE92_9ACTN|nr:hypothetical protein Dsi01nite_012260 [Dactylosporangium siamense]